MQFSARVFLNLIHSFFGCFQSFYCCRSYILSFLLCVFHKFNRKKIRMHERQSHKMKDNVSSLQIIFKYFYILLKTNQKYEVCLINLMNV